MTGTALIPNAREQLSALATHLGQQRGAILQRWRTATESATELTIASSPTHLQFNDYTPGVLEAYSQTLRAGTRADSRLVDEYQEHLVHVAGLQPSTCQKWSRSAPRSLAV